MSQRDKKMWIVIVAILAVIFAVMLLRVNAAQETDIDVSGWNSTVIIGTAVYPTAQGMATIASIRSIKDGTVSCVNIEGASVAQDVTSLVGSTLYVYPNTKAGDKKIDSMIIRVTEEKGWFW